MQRETETSAICLPFSSISVSSLPSCSAGISYIKLHTERGNAEGKRFPEIQTILEVTYKLKLQIQAKYYRSVTHVAKFNDWRA